MALMNHNCHLWDSYWCIIFTTSITLLVWQNPQEWNYWRICRSSWFLAMAGILVSSSLLTKEIIWLLDSPQKSKQSNIPKLAKWMRAERKRFPHSKKKYLTYSSHPVHAGIPCLPWRVCLWGHHHQVKSTYARTNETIGHFFSDQWIQTAGHCVYEGLNTDGTLVDPDPKVRM